MAEKCGILLNKSAVSASVKLNVPIIKLDECGDLEAMNVIGMCSNEEQYLTYNHIDAATKCICNSHETDADCSNIGLSNCDLGHVNCGSGKNSKPGNTYENRERDIIVIFYVILGVLCGSNPKMPYQHHNTAHVDSSPSNTNKLITKNDSGSGGAGGSGDADRTSEFTTTQRSKNKWLLGYRVLFLISCFIQFSM